MDLAGKVFSMYIQITGYQERYVERNVERKKPLHFYLKCFKNVDNIFKEEEKRSYKHK